MLLAAAALVSPPRAANDPGEAGVPQDWWSRVQDDIAALEYEVTWQDDAPLAGLDGAWQAPNRAHGFRTYFTGAGVRVVPRTEDQAPWEWRLALVGYGRGDQVWPVLRAAPAAVANRVEYARGSVVEWYVNDRRGLEQGFTLPGPPEWIADGLPTAAPRPDDGAVSLELKMTGDVRPVLSADRGAIDLVGTSSPLGVAHFRALSVRDAADRELPAWMELVPGDSGTRLYIVFDDREADYPVTVDPLLQSEAWGKEGNQTSAQFGRSVASAGNVNGDRVCRDGPDAGQLCGGAVTCAGGTCVDLDDVIIGAPAFDAGEADEGRVFVFYGAPSGLELQPAWTAESDQAAAMFGFSVAGAGDVNGDGFDDVVVGAYGFDGPSTNEGRAFVYHGSATGLDASPTWHRDGDNQATSYFGISVAGAGDVNDDGFDDVVIGASCYPNNSSCYGRAYVYYGSATGLGDPHWYCDGPQAWQFFGRSVAGAGDVNDDGVADLIIGSQGWDYDPTNIDAGRVYVYYGPLVDSAADWTKYLNQREAWFGGSVASAGDINGDGIDDVVIGAYGFNGTYVDGGRAYTYLGSPTGLEANDYYLVEGDENSENLGSSVAGAGDVNGDGVDDLIVGSPGWNGGGADRGRAMVFLGDPGWDFTNFAPTRSWNNTGESDQAYYGAAVASAGDVNGDGHDDVIVGSYNFSGDKSGEGKSYVYHGSRDAHASDLVVEAFERAMVCVGDGSAGSLCDDDADCGAGTCTGQVDFDNSGIVAYNSAASAPSPGETPVSDVTSAAAYYGELTHSILLSTGLAQDGGLGDTDWGRDGLPDVVRWQFRVNPPEGAKTFRFTTQFITNDFSAGMSRDSISLYLERKLGETPQTVNLMSVAGMSVREMNSPVSHGIRVDDITGTDRIRLIFEIRDGVDGAKDSALLISNLTFSGLPLPEGADPNGDYRPEILSNPSPLDAGMIAGVWNYEKTLLSVPGVRMPFELTIRYSSDSNRTTASLGKKWSHSFDSTLQKARILVDRNNDGSANDPEDIVVVRLPSGATEYFKCHEADGVCNTVSDAYGSKYVGLYGTLKQTALAPSASFEYETKQHVKYVFNVDVNASDGSTSDEYETYALRTITDTNGNAITLNYDANKRLDYVLDTRGTAFTFNYDATGRLVSVEDSQGGGCGVSFQQIDHFVEGVPTRLLGSFTDLNGYVTSFTYDGMANILTATDDDGTVFASNDYERYQIGLGLEQVGYRTVVRRSANPDDAGMRFTFGSDRVRQEDRVAGLEVVRYDVKAREHDRKTLLGSLDTGSSCTEADASCWAESSSEMRGVCANDPPWWRSCSSDTNCPSGSFCGSTHEPVLLTNPLGVRTGIRYSGAGNMIEKIEAHWEWGDPSTFALCVGGVQQGQLCVEDSDCPGSHCGVMSNMFYDGNNNLLARAIRPVTPGACGLPPFNSPPCYVYTYDTKNNLLTDSNEVGHAITYTYDTDVDGDGIKEGLKDTETNRRGFVTSYQYDTRGYPAQVTGPPVDVGGTPTAVVTQHAYDARGRRTWTRDPRSNETWFVYDTGGRKLSERNALDHTTGYTYDEWDRLLTKTHPDLMVETYDYTPTGRLARSTVPLGAVDTPGECAGMIDDGATCTSDAECDAGGWCAVAVKYSYDAEDRLAQKTDELGRTTAYTWDANRRLIGVTDPAGQTWTASYDAAGSMLGVTDPLNHETVYEYDLLGRVKTETDAEGHTVQTGHNARGSIATITRARGDTVSYTYDFANRLTGIALTGGRTITHTLDENGNPTATTDVGGVGPIARTFDAYDRLSTRTDPFGHVIQYEYDPAGNLTKLTYSNGDAVSYAYDALDRLTGVTDWDGHTTTYAYDAVGNLTSTVLPDSSGSITFAYDASHRLTGIAGPVYSASFTRDGSGAITSATEKLPLEPDIDATPHVMVYDAANRLVSRDGATFTYDADGNMASGPIAGTDRTMAYDALNRLVQLDGDVYLYDSDGLRVEVRPAVGPWIRYVYDPTGDTLRLLEEYSSENAGASWSLRARYVHGVGLISRADALDNIKLYHYEVRGSTVALTDPGSIIPTDTYAYDPYGRVSRQGLTPNPFTYNGRDGVVDDGGGLYFMRTRHYAPELMRFIQKDQRGQPKLDDPQSLNRYAYVKGDPVRFVDPNGDRWTEEDMARLGKIGLGLIPGVGEYLWARDFLKLVNDNKDDWQEEDSLELGKHILGAVPLVGDAISLFFLAADEAKEMVEDWATATRSQTINFAGTSITYGEIIDQCLSDPDCVMQVTTPDFWKRILSPGSPIFPPAPENSPAGPSAPNP